MGRHLGSRNKPKDDNGGIGHNSGLRDAVDGEELRGYIERIEKLNFEYKMTASLRLEVFDELKKRGYDAATVRALIKRRAMDADKLADMDALLDQYRAALGDFVGTALGQAMAPGTRAAAE
jgi:uncharacterized protein (UPF0335 family)